MSEHRPSDILFAVVSLIFFTVLAVIFFGQTVMTKGFWLSAIVIAAFAVLLTFGTRIAARFGVASQCILAFALGAAFNFCLQLAQSVEVIDYVFVAISGAAASVLVFVDRRRAKPENGTNEVLPD